PRLLGLLVLAFVALCMWPLSQALRSRFDLVQNSGVPPATTGDTAFVEEWSASITPPLVHEMALKPGSRAEFFALSNDEIHAFDSTGARSAKFTAPSKSTRMATDPMGALPYLMVASRNTKWTG